MAGPYTTTLLLKTPRSWPLVGPSAELRSIVSAKLGYSGQIVLLGRYVEGPASPALRTGLFQLHGGTIVPLLLEGRQTALAGPYGYSGFRQVLLNDSGAIVLTARRVDGGDGRNMILRIQGTAPRSGPRSRSA